MAYACQDGKGDYLYEGDNVKYDAVRKGIIEATVVGFVTMDKSKLILKTIDGKVFEGYCDNCEKIEIN